MQSRTNLFLIVVLATFTTLGFARQKPAAPPVASPSQQNEPNSLSFPYIAAITEDNVNIRSGPGTNFYSCGKLNQTEKVEVVATQLGWSQIVPPPACFSWISKQYVSVDSGDPAVGIVTGDDVRVYAGSESLKPIHSTTVQVKLNKGDRVALAGQEEDDYYKIAPPTGSYLWISSNYARPIGPAAAEAAVVTTQPAPALVPTTISSEAGKLEAYYALEKQLQAEKAKPMDQQNYETLKKAFLAIAGDKSAGKASRFAEFAVKQIERCELALLIGKEFQLQESQFQQTEDRIGQARDAKLAQIKDLGKYAAIGKFVVSNIYGAGEQMKRYRIVDDSGKTICYAVPTGAAAGMDLAGFTDRKVGLVGEIEPSPQTSGALVRFTEIDELN